MSTPLEQRLPPPPGAATPARGLTSAEARARAAAGLANVDTSKQRTDGDVIRANALTFFNVILGSMILALFLVGQFRDAFFVGIVVVANVAVSTFQEIRATRTLRELVALTAPTARVVRDGVEQEILATDVVQGDLVHLRTGDQVVADGHVTAETAEIDESLLTGESHSVLKGSGEELLSGSFCIGGDCYYTAERVGVEAYAVRLTADARERVRRMTPLELQVKRLVRVLLTATFILAAALMISYNVSDQDEFGQSIRDTTALVTTVVPAGLLLGMTVAFAVGAVRVSRAGAIVQEIQTVESLNYVDVVCMDKTGTITANRLTLDEVVWSPGAEVYQPWVGAFAAAVGDESKTAAALAEAMSPRSNGAKPVANVAFSSARRWSAMTLELHGEQRTFIMGAPENVTKGVSGEIEPLLERYRLASERGLRGVMLAEAPSLPDPDRPLEDLRLLGLVIIADVLRPEVRETFALMADLEIEPKIISGDNPETVAALMAQLDLPSKGYISGADLERLNEAGFDAAVEAHTVFGRISPQQKAQIVESLRKQGHFVAMVGDGANDVHALRAADTAVAMESGTSTARGVAGIILQNDSFAALIRGTREATFVLGNSARLSKLFIAKSIYAFLLIFATNLLGLSFPFLPRHGSLTSLLALGIPAVFISISIPPKRSGEDYLRNVLRFALPAAIALAGAAMLAQFIVEGILNRSDDEARTIVSLILGIGGILYVIEVLGFEGASWKSLTRPVMTLILGAALIGGLVLTVYTPWLRQFFNFTQVEVFDWTVIIIACAAMLAGQWFVSRHWQWIIQVMLASPGKDDKPRGRIV